MKTWLRRLLALAMGVLLALALGELGVRMLLPGYAPIAFDIYTQNTDGQIRLRPNELRQHASPEWNVRVETNAAGFRDTDTPPRPDRPVVVVLGDSMAFGWGVDREQALPARLEAQLQQQHARALNAGIPGTGTTDQLALLREHITAWRPSAVVLLFFVGNDFDDVASGGAAQYDIVDGRMTLKSRPPGRLGRVSSWLKSQSRLAQFVAERLWLLELRRNQSVPAERRAHPGLEQRDTSLRRFVQIHRREALPPQLQRGVVDTLFALEQMCQLVATHGARFLLAVLPRSIQAYDVDRRRYEQSFGLDPNDWDLDRPQRILRDWAAAHPAVELVDLLPAFQRAAASGTAPRLYFFPDSHMSAAGHRLAADELVNQLLTAPLTLPLN